MVTANLVEETSDLHPSVNSVHVYAPTQAPITALPFTSFPRAGETFLDFELICELGRGAFGRVFLARQFALANRLVALKVSTDAQGEIRTLAQLRHTNIVPVYSVHESEQLKAICMPYLGSMNLRHLLAETIRSGVLPDKGSELAKPWRDHQTTIRNAASETVLDGKRVPIEAQTPVVKQTRIARLPTTLERLEGQSYVNACAELVAALASGLSHAHERGILHRDIKPANIIITEEGEPMLVDFNLAEDLKCRAGGLRAFAGGTAPYASPEQIEEYLQRPAVVDERSDVFSLGVVLFELLTGRIPYGHDSSTNGWEATRETRRAPTPSARAFNQSVSARLDEVVKKCLREKAEHRYQNARELHEDLHACLANRPLVHAVDPTPSQRALRWALRNSRTIAFVGCLSLVASSCMLAYAVNVVANRTNASAVYSAAAPELKRHRLTLLERVTDRADFRKVRSSVLETLAPYGIAENEKWHENSAVSFLPPKQRDLLMKDATALLLLLSEASLVEARTTTGDDRKKHLDQADLWNSRAAAAWRERGLPAAILDQQATIAELRGVPEASDIRALARATVLTRDDADLAAVVRTAERDFEGAFSVLNNIPVASRDFHTVFLYGLCLRSVGERKAAYDVWKKCIDLDKSNVELHRLAGLLWNQGRAGIAGDVAFEHFSVAAKLSSKTHEEIARNQAHFLVSLRQVRPALDKLIESVDDAESKYYAWSRIRSLAKMGNEEKTVARADKMLASLTPKTWLDWYERGRMADESAEKMSAYRKSLELFPWSPLTLMSMVQDLKNRPEYRDEIVRVASIMLRLYPDDTKVHSSLDDLFVEKGT